MGTSTSVAYETDTATLTVDESGIVRVVIKAGASLGLEDMRRHFRVGMQHDGGKQRPVMVDTRLVKAVSREARAYACGPEAAALVSAQAVVVGSPVSRIIGSFFLGLNKPGFPTRMFTSEDEAADWLKGFLR